MLRLGKNSDEFAPKSGISDRIDARIIYYEAQDNIEALFDIPPTVPGWEENAASLKAGLELVRKNYTTRIGTSWLDLPNPFEACFLDQDRPFINRKDFRHNLQDLNKEGGKRFLIVNGPPGSGKTHSHYFVESLAPRNNFKFSFIELKQEIISKYYPDIMARRIDRDLALPSTEPLPEQQNVGERWAQELCDWLVEKLQLDGSRCWIVLDGFGNSNLPDETRRMVNSLVDAVDKRLPRVRLLPSRLLLSPLLNWSGKYLSSIIEIPIARFQF